MAMTSKIIMSFKYVLSWKVSSGRNKGQEREETFENKYDYDISRDRTIKEIKNQKVELATTAANRELDEMKAEAGRKKFNAKTVRVSRVFDITLKRVKAADRKDRTDRKDGKEEKSRYLPPGSYTGSFVLSFEFKVYDTKKQKVNRRSDDIVAIDRVVRQDDRLTQEDLVKEAIERYFVDEGNRWNNYDGFELVAYDTLDVALVEEQKSSLDAVPMKQTDLKYDFLGDLSHVNKNPGQCVFDYIVYEGIKSGMKKYTMPYLIQYFGQEAVEQGITTEAIIEWAKKERYISVHCVDPFLRSYASWSAPSDERHVSFSLIFICNNGHCYPILEDKMREAVVRCKRIDLDDFTFDIKFEDHAFIENDGQMLKRLMEEKKQVVIVDTDNLTKLMTDYMQETKQIIYNLKFSGHRVSAFQVPNQSETKQVVLTGQDYNERRELCKKLFEMTKSEMFVFRNQSFTQLASDYFEITVGKMRKSEYSNDLRQIYRTYKVAPYVAQVSEKGTGDCCEAFDIKACFTSILINNEIPYNVFTAMDVVEKFNNDSQLVNGIYFVNRMVKMADETIVLPRNWYSLVLVKYLLTKKYIAHQDITHVLPAGGHYAADTFKEFAETLHKLGDKRLVNHFIGNLNKQAQRKTRGVVSDNYETAMSLLMDEKLNGRNPSILKVNNLYHIRSNTFTELSKTHAPIWRHVIESSYIVLDKLYHDVAFTKEVEEQMPKAMQNCNPISRVISYNTDGIIILEPKSWLELKELVPGDIRRVEANPRGHFISELTDNEPYVLSRAPITEVKEDIQFLRDHGCLVVGMPGCGKTEMIRRTYNDQSIAFCYTNKAADVLRKRGIDNVHTFDSYFFEMKASRPIDSLGTYSVIYVDEYSMVPSCFISILLQIKNKYPNMQIRLFGDADQCKPVEPKHYEYYRHPTIMALVDNNIMELQYKEQFARYDKSLYDVLCYFRQHKRLPQTLKDRKIKQTPINICYYRSTKKRINEECFARYSEDKKVERVNGVPYYVGMPIVIIKNRKDIDVYNSQIYKITEITDKHVKIKDDSGEKLILRHLFTKDLVNYAYCITVYQYQGATITDEYSIHDMDGDGAVMNFNHVYTSLSRGVSLSKVYFNYNNRQYKNLQPSKKSIEHELKVSVINAKIYEITDGKKFYIGSTERSLSERLAEHKIKPVNKPMKKFMQNNVSIRLLAEVSVPDKLALHHEEDKYIKMYCDKYGDNVLNCKWNVKRKIVETKTAVVQKLDIDRFKIVKNETKKIFCIQYRDENGKKISKEWGYARNEEAAYQRALQHQGELRTKYYL